MPSPLGLQFIRGRPDCVDGAVYMRSSLAGLGPKLKLPALYVIGSRDPMTLGTVSGTLLLNIVAFIGALFNSVVSPDEGNLPPSSLHSVKRGIVCFGLRSFRAKYFTLY